MIFNKLFGLRRLRRDNDDFEQSFWSGKNLNDLYASASADEPGGNNFRGVKSAAVDALIKRVAAATTLTELRTASHALDRVVMWSHWQIPQLFANGEPVSYWNKFGRPGVAAKHFSIDSYSGDSSAPWPLWTWWDKSLDKPETKR